MARADWDVYNSAGLSNGQLFTHASLASPLTGHGINGFCANLTGSANIGAICRKAGRENLPFRTSTEIRAWMRSRSDTLATSPYVALFLAHPNVNPKLVSEAQVATGYNLTMYSGQLYLQAFRPGGGNPVIQDFSVVAWTGATVNVWHRVWFKREYVTDTRLVLTVRTATLAAPNTFTLRHTRTINSTDVGFYTGVQATMGFDISSGSAAGPIFPGTFIDGVECGPYTPGAFD